MLKLGGVRHDLAVDPRADGVDDLVGQRLVGRHGPSSFRSRSGESHSPVAVEARRAGRLRAPAPRLFLILLVASIGVLP